MFSYEFSYEPRNLLPQNRCFVRGLRQFSAHLTKNSTPATEFHLVATWRSPDNAICKKNTQHDTSRVLRLPRKMTMDTSKKLRLPRKLEHIFWKRRKSIARATQNGFQHVTKHVWMSRSATPATRNEAMPHVKLPKVTPFAELTIGTAIRGSRGRLRTVADGCERLGNVERTHPQPPDPQSETGTLATHSGKTAKSECFAYWAIGCFQDDPPQKHSSPGPLRSSSRVKKNKVGISILELGTPGWSTPPGKFYVSWCSV